MAMPVEVDVEDVVASMWPLTYKFGAERFSATGRVPGVRTILRQGDALFTVDWERPEEPRIIREIGRTERRQITIDQLKHVWNLTYIDNVESNPDQDLPLTNVYQPVDELDIPEPPLPVTLEPPNGINLLKRWEWTILGEIEQLALTKAVQLRKLREAYDHTRSEADQAREKYEARNMFDAAQRRLVQIHEEIWLRENGQPPPNAPGNEERRPGASESDQGAAQALMVHIQEPVEIQGTNQVQKTAQEGGETSKGVGETSEGVGETSKGVRETSEGVGETSKGVRETLEGAGETSKGVGETSEGPRETSVRVGETSVRVGETSEGVRESSERVREATEEVKDFPALVQETVNGGSIARNSEFPKLPRDLQVVPIRPGRTLYLVPCQEQSGSSEVPVLSPPDEEHSVPAVFAGLPLNPWPEQQRQRSLNAGLDSSRPGEEPSPPISSSSSSSSLSSSVSSLSSLSSPDSPPDAAKDLASMDN